MLVLVEASDSCSPSGLLVVGRSDYVLRASAVQCLERISSDRPLKALTDINLILWYYRSRFYAL